MTREIGIFRAIGFRQTHVMQIILLEALVLEDKTHPLPEQLSGGEQERVAIARAIVNKLPIIMADEPTGNLDSATAMEIMALLKGLNDEGHTIIMVTHNAAMEAHATRSTRLILPFPLAWPRRPGLPVWADLQPQGIFSDGRDRDR